VRFDCNGTEGQERDICPDQHTPTLAEGNSKNKCGKAIKPASVLARVIMWQIAIQGVGLL
jgi:hypothetical protein